MPTKKTQKKKPAQPVVILVNPQRGGALTPAMVAALAPIVERTVGKTLDFTTTVLQDPTRVRRVEQRQDRRDTRAKDAHARAERQRAETDKRRQDAYDRKIRLQNERDKKRR